MTAPSPLLNFDAIIQSVAGGMTQEEQSMLLTLVRDFKDKPEELVVMLESLSGFDWSSKPVDVETFLLHKDYLGLKGELFPKLLDDLVELFSGNYNEGVFTGAIGYGKSSVAECAQLIMLYQASCLRDPQRAYGLMEGSKIAFINASVNLKQATNVVFHGIKQKLIRSPYFREQFPFDAETQKEMRFPKNLWITPVAASEGGTIGFNVLGGVLDECNFWDVTEHSAMARGGRFDQARTVHTMLLRRIKSRFSRGGKLPGVLLSVSSSKYPDDFTEQRIEEAADDPTIMWRRYSTWATKPKHHFSPTTFWLYRGGSSERPAIADTKAEFASKDEGLLVEVPVDFKNDFTVDIDGAIRDLAGYPTLSIHPFLPQKDKLMEAIERGRLRGMVHPYSVVETSLDDGAHLVHDRLKFDPSKWYFSHVDLAISKDSCGLAIGHVDKWVTVQKTADDGVMVEDTMPVVVIDLMLRITAPTGGEIQVDAVRGLLLECRERGCNLRKVTYDQYNSASSIQAFQRLGIESERMSVDRPMDAYNAFKEAILEDRLILYPYMPLVEEVVRLEVNERKGKVDHAPKSKKDVSDAVVGVVMHCVLARPTAASVVMHGETYGGAEMDTQTKQMERIKELKAKKAAAGQSTNVSFEEMVLAQFDEEPLDDSSPIFFG